jgi:hypothetical protein
MKNLMKKSLASIVLAVFIMTVTLGNVCAYAETGWKRLDDRSGYFPFEGNWPWFEDSNCYMNNYTVAVDKGDSLKFNFTGSKLRLIGNSVKNKDTKMKVEIDGKVAGIFTQYSETTKYNVVNFETTQLADKEHYVKISFDGTPGIPNYSLDCVEIGEGKSVLAYNESIQKASQIEIKPTTNLVNIGQEFTTDVVVNNVSGIFAEDLKVSYDTTLFEYIGYEDVKGLKVYKENHDSAIGSLRFIVASQGKSNPINGGAAVVKLKFKAKAIGEGKVDAIAGRIADLTTETDIAAVDCGEALIKIVGNLDVNRSGEFSLVDLAIDAYYFGDLASNTDKTKYDADVVIDGNINDTDLSTIVSNMLANKNYTPNN